MKPAFLLASILFFLSCISGYLLSKASLVGRTGINLFYKEYKFLKTPWQGALLVFIVLILLLFLQGMVQKRLGIKMARAIQFFLLLVAIAGLYLPTSISGKCFRTNCWVNAFTLVLIYFGSGG